MYQIKPIFMGNADRGQDNSPVKPITFSADTIQDLREKIRFFLDINGLGAGNWGTAKVIKDGKIYGFMSYNGRIWDKDLWNKDAKEVL